MNSDRTCYARGRILRGRMRYCDVCDSDLGERADLLTYVEHCHDWLELGNHVTFCAGCLSKAKRAARKPYRFDLRRIAFKSIQKMDNMCCLCALRRDDTVTLSCQRQYTGGSFTICVDCIEAAKQQIRAMGKGKR